MKNLLVVLGIVAILGIGGYFYLNSRGVVPNTPGAMMGKNSAKGGGVFTSIKDALSKSVSLKCVYKDEAGVESTTYIKSGAVRVMMAAGSDTEQPNNYVMKDKMMYMWSDATKQGIKISLDEPEDISPYPTVPGQESIKKNEGSEQKESLLGTIEKYKDACKPEAVADSMFSIPEEVVFQDMNALRDQMMQGLPQAPKGDGNSQDYQKYLEEMMQQQDGQ